MGSNKARKVEGKYRKGQCAILSKAFGIRMSDEKLEVWRAKPPERNSFIIAKKKHKKTGGGPSSNKLKI